MIYVFFFLPYLVWCRSRSETSIKQSPALGHFGSHHCRRSRRKCRRLKCPRVIQAAIHFTLPTLKVKVPRAAIADEVETGGSALVVVVAASTNEAQQQEIPDKVRLLLLRFGIGGALGVGRSVGFWVIRGNVWFGIGTTTAIRSVGFVVVTRNDWGGHSRSRITRSIRGRSTWLVRSRCVWSRARGRGRWDSIVASQALGGEVIVKVPVRFGNLLTTIQLAERGERTNATTSLLGKVA
jgi:hypothetical protein